MATMTVLDSTGATVTVEKPLTPGRVAAALSRPVVLSNEDNTNLAAIATAASDTTTPSPIIARLPNYKTIAASATDQVMGTTGAIGDILSYMMIIPATTSPGAVSLKDGAGAAITVFTGGANSVSNLVPFPVDWGAVSLSGAWKITTGAGVSAIAFGRFT